MRSSWYVPRASPRRRAAVPGFPQGLGAIRKFNGPLEVGLLVFAVHTSFTLSLSHYDGGPGQAGDWRYCSYTEGIRLADAILLS